MFFRARAKDMMIKLDIFPHGLSVTWCFYVLGFLWITWISESRLFVSCIKKNSHGGSDDILRYMFTYNDAMMAFDEMMGSKSFKEKQTPIKGVKTKYVDKDQGSAKLSENQKKQILEQFGTDSSNRRLSHLDVTTKGNFIPDNTFNIGENNIKDSLTNISSNRLKFLKEHIKPRKHKKLVIAQQTKHKNRHRGGKRTKLYIGGLFELSGSEHEANGKSELDAALLAVKHVNAMRVIPGYELKLLFNDTKCDPGTGTNAFYDLIYRKPRMLMVMGSACVEVTKTIAEIVPNWNLILISYATTSPALSEREKYTTFFRLAPADSSLNPARRMFIQYFRWDTVAILYEEKEMFSLAVDDISVDLANHNISQQAVLSFKTVHEIPEKMNQLQASDLRIVIAAFSESAARQVFCEAYRLRMFGPRFVWILCGGIFDKWWLENGNASCPRHELRAATEGVIVVSSLNKLMGHERSVDDLNYSEFLSIYSRANGSQPLSTHATTTYDTVWTMALTIKKTLQHRRDKFVELPDLDQLNYTELAPVKDNFFNIIEKLDFHGVSGPVSFKGPDRESRAVVYQNQGGNLTIIAIHDPDSEELNFACQQCRDLIWQGGRVPRDKKLVLHRQKTIDPTIFYIACALCVFGIILAVCFLSYNLHHRKLRYIKLSSPKLNNVAVIGCILVYTAVIVLGLDDDTLGWDLYPLICSTRAFLLAAGFSLSFGAMFAKTYRVHQIFTRANSGLVKSKLLRDKHLLFIIGVLLMVDSGIVIVWVIVDPMEPKITNLTEEAPDDEDILLVHQLTTCYSHHLQKWLGVFYVYKGLLLVFGVYMAWETRSVKIPALNDSQYIGLNVYNVVIMSLSVVVLSNILDNQPTRAYTMESIFMFLSTTVTLCLLFVPKIYVIVSSKGNPVIATSGILVEANTRRFVFDDKKEIYYRAEVQNRVYKRELVELSQEIVRLEQLLELPVHPYPRLSKELLFLLPESRVDDTPLINKKRREELQRCTSISDDCSASYEQESDDAVGDIKHNLPNHHQVSKRHSGDERNESTIRKLCRLSRSLSIGHTSHAFPQRMGRDPWSPGPRTPMLKTDSNKSKNLLSANFRSKNNQQRKSESALDFKGGNVLFKSSDTSLNPLLEKNLQPKHNDVRRKHKSPRHFDRICDNVSKHSVIEERSESASSLESEVAVRSYSFSLYSTSDGATSRTNIPDSQSNEILDRTKSRDNSAICDTKNNAKPRDVESAMAMVRTRSLSKLQSVRALIEHERRLRIKKLQSDLLCIQRELQDLDDLEYEVSQV